MRFREKSVGLRIAKNKTLDRSSESADKPLRTEGYVSKNETSRYGAELKWQWDASLRIVERRTR